jgi:DNA polymerase-3 subunit alpha/DNA polymerase-3 subunit epsilon
MRHLYFDVETDGLGAFRPPTQRLMQLGWVLRGPAGPDGSPEREERCFLVRGVSRVSPSVPHRISAADCTRDGVDFGAAYAAFLEAVGLADALVAHNIEFDVGVVRLEVHTRLGPAALESLDALLHSKRLVCSMRATTEHCRLPARSGSAGHKFPTLTELHRTLFGSDPGEALHDALEDCRVLERCYVEFMRRMAPEAA